MSTLKAVPGASGRAPTGTAPGPAPAPLPVPAPSDEGRPSPWATVGAQGAGLTLNDYPSALLMRVANKVQSGITAVYARHNNLTVPEWRLLARLHESAPLQLATLCRTSFFDKAYAGRVLRALAAKGLVKVEADATHGRRQIVDITAEGRRLAGEILPVARASQMKLLQVLEPQERESLYAVLQKLMHATPHLTASELRVAPKTSRASEPKRAAAKQAEPNNAAVKKPATRKARPS